MITILMGKSASGKDTILKYLRDNYDYKPIVSITTRPARDGEVDGVDYVFTNPKLFETLIATNQLIEWRTYNTWYYGTRKIIPDDSNYVVVLDKFGAKNFINHFGESNTTVIFVCADEHIRRIRAESRGSFDEMEWKRRIKADDEMFSDYDDIVDLWINNDGTCTIETIANLIDLKNKERRENHG